MAAPLDLGLRFIVEPSGTSLSSEESRALRELRPAGIMLRRRNFRQDASYAEWLADYAKLLSDVRAAIGRDRIIVSVDHEGGQVHRFPAPITRFPYPAFYASELEAVTAVATAMAAELASLGVNVSFSPTADIHSNPQNPVINQRAFGTTAAQVCPAVVSFAKALRAGGITPCAKHFPGHGDTSVDSHLALPSVDRSLSELETREFLPFAALIRENVEMIMSAHIALPQVDPGVPATISRKIMTGILREKLGFSGVVIADALGMKGISDLAQPSLVATRAHEAGVDLMLMVGDTVTLSDAVAAKESLAQYAAGATQPQKVDLAASQGRITALLASLPQRVCAPLPADVLDRHAKLAQALSANSQWAKFDFNPVGFT